MKLSILLVIFSFLIMNVSEAQTKNDFCKKWHLTGYLYWGLKFSPEANEKNDYLYFKSDGTFTSKDEGEVEYGTWKWMPRSQQLYCYDSKTKETLPLKVVSVSKTKLVVRLEAEDEELTIIFKTQK